MQTVSSISPPVSFIESQLEKITIQNKLQDIINIINQFQKDSENHKLKKKKNKQKNFNK